MIPRSVPRETAIGTTLVEDEEEEDTEKGQETAEARPETGHDPQTADIGTETTTEIADLVEIADVEAHGATMTETGETGVEMMIAGIEEVTPFRTVQIQDCRMLTWS